jgi:hypothetical protein
MEQNIKSKLTIVETSQQPQYDSEDWKPHWNRLKHLLVPAIEIQDLYILEDIEEGIESGQFQLWPATKSIMITEVVTYPQKRIMNLLFCGGDVEDFWRCCQSLKDLPPSLDVLVSTEGEELDGEDF